VTGPRRHDDPLPTRLVDSEIVRRLRAIEHLADIAESAAASARAQAAELARALSEERAE
jgi:hypothetical protein